MKSLQRLSAFTLRKNSPAAAVKEESSGSLEGQDSAGKSSSTAPLGGADGIGQGYKTVFISQRDVEAAFLLWQDMLFWGASGSCSGTERSLTQGKLKAVSIQDPVEDRPAGHTGPAAADGLCQGLGGLRREPWRTVPICLNKCGKTPSRSMGGGDPATATLGRWESRSSQPDPPLMAWQRRGPWDGRYLRSQ